MTPALSKSSNCSVAAFEAEGALAAANLLDDHGSFDTRVAGDLTQRLFGRPADQPNAHRLVAFELHSLEGHAGAQERDATAGHDALFDGRAGRVQRVFHAGLLLLHLGLGVGADLDYRDAAGELGQPLLQLLLVVVAARLVDLFAQRLDAALDLLRSRPRRR